MASYTIELDLTDEIRDIVDDSYLRVENALDEDRVNGLIDNRGFVTQDDVDIYLGDQGFLTESAIDDKLGSYVTEDDIDDRVESVLSSGSYIESAVSDSLDNILEDRIDNDLSNRDFQTESDVEMIISNELDDRDFVDRSDVERMIDDSLDDAPVKDLERRLDTYAQRIDQLRSENTALGAALANQREAQLDYQRQLNLLRQDVDTLNEQAGKAITLFELLRRAVEVLFK